MYAFQKKTFLIIISALIFNNHLSSFVPLKKKTTKKRTSPESRIGMSFLKGKIENAITVKELRMIDRQIKRSSLPREQKDALGALLQQQALLFGSLKNKQHQYHTKQDTPFLDEISQQAAQKAQEEARKATAIRQQEEARLAQKYIDNDQAQQMLEEAKRRHSAFNAQKTAQKRADIIRAGNNQELISDIETLADLNEQNEKLLLKYAQVQAAVMKGRVLLDTLRRKLNSVTEFIRMIQPKVEAQLNTSRGSLSLSPITPLSPLTKPSQSPSVDAPSSPTTPSR